MHFVRTFSIMRAYGIRLIAIEEAQNYRKIVYKNIFENGWWEKTYLSFNAPGHTLQKTSKESGIFQSLGTISFVLFY